jgi:hypothetical protein
VAGRPHGRFPPNVVAPSRRTTLHTGSVVIRYSLFVIHRSPNPELSHESQFLVAQRATKEFEEVRTAVHLLKK